MPLYEYRCQDCGERLEILQRVGQGGEDLECPGCGHQGLQKLHSTFAASVAGGSASACGAPSSGGGCGAGGFT